MLCLGVRPGKEAGSDRRFENSRLHHLLSDKNGLFSPWLSQTVATSLAGGRSRARTADLLLVRQRRSFHSVHQAFDFAWPYVNSGDLLSLQAQPVPSERLGILTQVLAQCSAA